MIGFLVRFSSYTKNPSTSITKNSLSQTPVITKIEVLEKDLQVRLGNLKPREYSAHFDQLFKTYSKSTLPSLQTIIKKHLESLPITTLEEICFDFPCETSSLESNETLIRILISIPEVLNKKKVLIYLSSIVRVKKFSSTLLEDMKNACNDIAITPVNHEILSSISRSIKNYDKLAKISKYLQSNHGISLQWQIKTFFHINKSKAMDDVAKKYLLKYKKHFSKEPINILNRLCDIYLTDNQHYPEFLDFLKENIKIFTEKSTDRELLNLFNYLGVNFTYSDEKIISSIYESLKKRNLKLNSMDVATLFHNLRKFSLQVTPFLPLVTNEILYKASGIETAILYHSLYKYETNEKLQIMKNNIMKDFNSLSPKHILNFAKDLVEDKNLYDKEFTDAFEKKAEEAFIKFVSPDTVKFKTQLITYYYLKHKNELNIESDLSD